MGKKNGSIWYIFVYLVDVLDYMGELMILNEFVMFVLMGN